MTKKDYETWFTEVASRACSSIDAFRLTYESGEQEIFKPDTDVSICERMTHFNAKEIVKVEFKGTDHGGEKWLCTDERVGDAFLRVSNGENLIGIPSELKRRETT